MAKRASSSAAPLVQDHQWETFDRIFEQFTALSARLGLPLDGLRSRFNQAIAKAPAATIGRSGESPNSLRDLHAQAEIMQYWFQNVDFVDPAGRPKSLPKTGRCGFSGLVRRAAPNVSTSLALRLLLNAKAIKIDTRGRVVPLSFSHIHADPAMRAMTGLHAVLNLLNTVVSNLDKPTPTGLYQRESETVRFDARELGRVNRYFREQADNFLRQMDGHAHQYQAAPIGDSRKTVDLFVGTYMAVRPIQSPPKPSRRVKRIAR